MTLSPELQARVARNYPSDWTDLDTRAVDTVRVLAADAVQKCGSGHPGTAMSLAPLAYTLYQRVMRLDPKNPKWAGRDRFVLSCGHSSLTQYIQLYLAGFGLELDDIKALRTWGSLTPGHPEYGHTDGVEITTGPLGQGLASAVGMAMAARRERGLFDPEAPAGQSPFDHFVYVIASDGDVQEGVTAEASSLAGTQQLGNLIVFWDDNGISIEDDTTIAFTENVADRYRAYGWQVIEVDGGEDVAAIERAVEEAKADTQRPTFIRVRTVIAYPAPNAMNTGASHGAALGDEEIALIKRSPASTRSRPSRSPTRSSRTPAPSPTVPPRTARPGRRPSTSGPRRTRRARSCSIASPPASCPRATPTRCRRGSRTPRAWPPARPPRPRCRPWARPCRSCGAARPTSPARTTP